MKKFKKLFIPALLCISIMVFIFNCSSNEEAIEIEKNYPEKILIDRYSFSVFNNSYHSFINSATEGQKKLIESYITDNGAAEIVTKQKKVGRTATADCKCEGGGSTCSARATFSECCICCPFPRAAACGTYFGFAFCNCEDIAIPRIENSNKNDKDVSIYPKRFDDFLIFSEKNGMNISEIRIAFDTLIRE